MKNINNNSNGKRKKRGEGSAFSNYQILKFNLLIVNVVIFY
jgi:hypothetical protein